jgi:FkbM family methyltransferase
MLVVRRNIYTLNFLFLLISHALNFSSPYPRPFDTYYSQKGQDKFLNEYLFKNKQNGTFVEIGAHDGISFSNTYFFEKNLKWAGICVEPNPNMFAKLRLNRDCICEQLCISDSEGQRDFLLCTGYMLEMYSGLLDNYDPRHLDRIEQEMQQFGGDKTVITVACRTLQNLFEKYNLRHIDLLSVDIEGGELAAIKSIDFDKVHIDVILIENNFNESYVKDYLEAKNYLLINHIGKDDIYVFAKEGL